MENESPLVITISRQLGSGGALLGQKLAEKLGMLYLDQKIIKEVAEKLGVLTEDIEWRDERIISEWRSVIKLLASVQPKISYPMFEMAVPNVPVTLSNKELFEAESEIISRVAKEKPAVIIGRCGSYILRNHPKHVSIFLHANIEFRKQNVQEYYGVSDKDAAQIIESADKYRIRYIHEFTGCDMNDARQYHLSIDAGVLGLDGAVNLVSEYIQNRFGYVDLKSIDDCN